MRQLNDILNAHFNYNFKYDHSIPMPSDYLTENELSISDFAKFVPNTLFKDEMMVKTNLINSTKLAKFSNRKRLFIFVLASHNRNIDQFTLTKLFRPKYV